MFSNGDTMGDPIERKETTNYAKKNINTFLKKQEYISALLLVWIYVDIRLRTLLTDFIEPQNSRWNETSEILGKISTKELIILCFKKYKLILKDQNKVLHQLNEKRNKVAHESSLWRTVPQDDQVEIEGLCKSAIQFLEDTTITTNNQKRSA